jgi:haloalkane dehalogenase
MHDWGGMIGMAYAARFPERIGRLVMLNTAAFHLPKPKTADITVAVPQYSLGELIIRDTGLFTSVLARWAVCSPWSGECAKDTCCRGRRKTAPPCCASCRTPAATQRPSYGLVSEVQAKLPDSDKPPTLILWGDRDFCF